MLSPTQIRSTSLAASRTLFSLAFQNRRISSSSGAVAKVANQTCTHPQHMPAVFGDQTDSRKRVWPRAGHPVSGHSLTGGVVLFEQGGPLFVARVAGDASDGTVGTGRQVLVVSIQPHCRPVG